MRARLRGGVVAVVCTTTALALGVTPALGAATPTTAAGATTTTGAATTSAAAVSTTATPTVSSPSFGLGTAQGSQSTTVVSTTPSTTTTSTTGTGLSGGDGILIGVVVVGLLLGIAAFVMRDARSHTANDPDVSDDPFASKRKGSKAPPKSRKLKPAERKRRKRSRAPRKRW